MCFVNQNIRYRMDIIKKIFWDCSSFKGSFARLPFWGAIVFGSMIYGFCSQIPVPYADNIAWLAYFYISLNAYQKRCRDLSIKGTWIILSVSIFFLYMALMHPSGLDKSPQFLRLSQTIFIIYIFVYLYSQFMPGAKKKDMSKRSPLLKNPPLYFLICVIIYAIFSILKANK